MRYTEQQKIRALKKLTRAFAKWNLRQGGTETEVLLAIWPTLRKFGMDKYYFSLSKVKRPTKGDRQ